MLSVGVDLGGHTISAALVEGEGKDARILYRVDRDTPQGRDIHEVVDCIAVMTAEVSHGSEISYAGVGIPGFLDVSRMVITKLTNFSGLENIAFLDYLKHALEKRGMSPLLAMENDANCFAVGEAFCGAAVGCKDFIVLTLGTGIGSGIFVNGSLVTGAHGMAGEAGHISISEHRDLRCGCGSTGHLETLASADHIERKAAREGLPGDFRSLWQMRDDKRADGLISKALETMARGIASLIVVLDPEKIILSGGMSKAEGIAEELEARTLPWLPLPMREHLSIEVSSLGADAGLYGAASISLLRRLC
ncbi:MAG: ROK family protein [Synergistota bacterium]|nr:ROK family protein [Synergistota bacterium]